METSPKERHSRLKGAQEVRKRQFRIRAGSPLRNTGRVGGAAARPASGQQAIQILSGDVPPYNDKTSWVSDPFEGKAYMVNGERPNEKNNMPTTDLYCLDIASKKWKNLTKCLRYRKPYSPFSVEERRREFKELPLLSLPDCILFRFNGTSLILIFGGFDVDAEKASHRLIVVDLKYLEWWYQPVEGGQVAGRIDPTIVVIDKKLYIFGGYSHFAGNGSPHRSYSIAALSDDGVWHWDARDVPYPSNIPKGLAFGRATPIYGGTKILLTPWRTTNSDRLNFTEQNLFCFHIARQKFQLVDVTGDFPRDIGWYFTFSSDVFSPPPSISAPPVRLEGRSRKSPPTPPTSSAPPRAISSVTSLPSSSALICCWTKSGSSFVPELWYLELTPTERIRKLDIGPMVRGHDFECAIMTSGRFLLFGSQSEDDCMSDNSDDSDPLFNVYLDVPLPQLGYEG